MTEIGIGTGIIGDYGVIVGFFIIILGSFIYYFPKLIKQHFLTMKVMQESYSENVEKILKTHTEINEKMLLSAKESNLGFIASIKCITKEHEKQNEKLEEIHKDIIRLHK